MNAPTDTARSAPRPSPVRPFWLVGLGRPVLAPLVLFFCALILFAPGITELPPIDRDEPRYTQATRQMAETGELIDIRFQDDPRYKKPVGIYWLQLAAIQISGAGAGAPLWVYRLVSVLGAALAVVMCYVCARSFLNPQASLAASLMLAATLLLNGEARLAKTDAVLLATIIATQAALARIWTGRAEEERNSGAIIAFWICLALSVLVKGPIGPMIVGACLATLCVMDRSMRTIRQLAPQFGLALFLLITLPWFVAIGLRSQGAFFVESLGIDFLGKVATGRESHGAPPLTHLAFAIVTFWPVPALLALCIPELLRHRLDPCVRFMLAWIIPSWVIFEVTVTKLPHYTLPLLPALCILTTLGLYRLSPDSPGAARKSIAVGFLFVPVAILIVAAIAVPIYLGDPLSPVGLAVLVAGAGLTMLAARMIVEGGPLRALGPLVLATLCLSGGITGFVLPSIQSFWISDRLVRQFEALQGCREIEVAVAGFHEPSLVFLGGTNTQLVDAEPAARFIAGGDATACRIVAVDKAEQARFFAALDDIVIVEIAGARVSGLNVNGGEDIAIQLYRQLRLPSLDPLKTEESGVGSAGDAGTPGEEEDDGPGAADAAGAAEGRGREGPGSAAIRPDAS